MTPDSTSLEDQICCQYTHTQRLVSNGYILSSKPAKVSFLHHHFILEVGKHGFHEGVRDPTQRTTWAPLFSEKGKPGRHLLLVAKLQLQETTAAFQQYTGDQVSHPASRWGGGTVLAWPVVPVCHSPIKRGGGAAPLLAPPSLTATQSRAPAGTGERGEDVVVVWAPPQQPGGSPGVGSEPGVQDLLPRQRELLPGRPRRRRGVGPGQPQGRAPALVQGHALQHPRQGRGGHAGVRARQQGNGARHQALPRPVAPGEAGSFQPGAGGRVGAVDGEQGRGQGLPLHPHGEQHPPQLRRLPRRQGPRRRARRHRRRPLGVVQGREPELEDPSLGPRGERRRARARRQRRRASRARLLQGRRRGLLPDGAQRDGMPGAHQPARRVPALDQGHAAQHPGAGRGRLPGLRAGEQGHRRGAQALHGAGPPREAGALQPGVPGRVRALDREPRRRRRLPLRPHGQQHLPQLRRLPWRQGARRRPRRHRDRALEVVRGRQPALEDPPMVDEGHRRNERRCYLIINGDPQIKEKRPGAVAIAMHRGLLSGVCVRLSVTVWLVFPTFVSLLLSCEEGD